MAKTRECGERPLQPEQEDIHRSLGMVLVRYLAKSGHFLGQYLGEYLLTVFAKEISNN